VVGLGNPILGDDGVGWRVAEEVLSRLEALDPRPDPPKVVVERLSVGGLALMERMAGCARAIIVDSITTGEGTIGSLTCLPLSALPDQSAGHLASVHDTTLQNALSVGREMRLDLPSEIWVVVIRAVEVRDFSEKLSPAVQDAIPAAVDVVLDLITSGSGDATQ
jgi:hydrogenase maturation protease